MSRNDDRLGLDHMPQEDSSSTPVVATSQQQTSQDTAFNWSVPTEFVELPSGGRFYPPGHSLHNQNTIEIRYMTAKEEDILTSRSLLKEGVALDRMLQNLVIDGSINVNSLLVGDKNALLVAARRTGYGPEYETKVACPSCGTTVDHSFDISSPSTNNFEKSAEEFGVSFDASGHATITLPMTGVKVECRLLTGADETRVTKEAIRKSKKKMESTSTTDAFRAFVVSVNGDNNPFTLENFIQNMPARDARHLRTIYNEVIPNINLEQNFECSNCGHEADMEVPLGIDFFWPK